MLSITLSNLTYLSIHLFDAKFDEFEMFIRKIYSKLKVLGVINESDDIDFLDSHRWKQLILQYLPSLEKLYLQYFEDINDDYKYPIYSGKLNQFSSSFWVKRQWIFDVEIGDKEIIYCICPYRKRWYEYTHDKIINSSTDIFKSNRLILQYIFPDQFDELINIKIKRVLTVVQIYHLETLEEDISIDNLIQIINSLPDLISIKIHSLSLAQSIDLLETKVDIHYSTINTNKITKVYLDNITGIEEIYFLMILCPNIEYLKIDWIGNINDQLFVENILKKINQECNDHFRLLCFHISAADDETIKNLEKIIHLKKLLLDYKIKRVLDNIYLEWK